VQTSSFFPNTCRSTAFEPSLTPALHCPRRPMTVRLHQHIQCVPLVIPTAVTTPRVMSFFSPVQARKKKASCKHVSIVLLGLLWLKQALIVLMDRDRENLMQNASTRHGTVLARIVLARGSFHGHDGQTALQVQKPHNLIPLQCGIVLELQRISPVCQNADIGSCRATCKADFQADHENLLSLCLSSTV
jgi:hypothetical protein